MSLRATAHPHHAPAHGCQVKATVTLSTAMLHGTPGAAWEPCLMEDGELEARTTQAALST